jgi:hypothetical protein
VYIYSVSALTSAQLQHHKLSISLVSMVTTLTSSVCLPLGNALCTTNNLLITWSISQSIDVSCSMFLLQDSVTRGQCRCGSKCADLDPASSCVSVRLHQTQETARVPSYHLLQCTFENCLKIKLCEVKTIIADK